MVFLSFTATRAARVAASLLLMSACEAAFAQTTQHVGLPGNQTSRISKVFVNLTGDTRLSRRLWSFIDFELEDAGIMLMNTEVGADTIINGQVDPEITNHRLSLGVARIELTVNGKTETVDSCESLSSDENGDVFNQSAEAVAEKIREKFPTARTVKLDSVSNTKASETFASELPGWLKKSGFGTVESPTADVFLRVDLTRENVLVEEDGVKYGIGAFYRDGSTLFDERGDGILSAKLLGTPPELCPDRVADLEWLYGDDPLFRVARDVARQIRRHNMKVAVASPSSGVITR